VIRSSLAWLGKDLEGGCIVGFLLEGNREEVLSERSFGCAQMNYSEFGKGELRKVVEDP
jgi:hypothetical protein